MSELRELNNLPIMLLGGEQQQSLLLAEWRLATRPSIGVSSYCVEFANSASSTERNQNRYIVEQCQCLIQAGGPIRYLELSLGQWLVLATIPSALLSLPMRLDGVITYSYAALFGAYGVARVGMTFVNA